MEEACQAWEEQHPEAEAYQAWEDHCPLAEADLSSSGEEDPSAAVHTVAVASWAGGRQGAEGLHTAEEGHLEEGASWEEAPRLSREGRRGSHLPCRIGHGRCRNLGHRGPRDLGLHHAGGRPTHATHWP